MIILNKFSIVYLLLFFFFFKFSKCLFGQVCLEYLGPIISANGVAPDNSKFSTMLQWPLPTTLKQLRGFLGLTGYYRRIIKNYASLHTH